MPMILGQAGGVNRDDERCFSWLGCADCIHAKHTGQGIICEHERGPKPFVSSCLRQRPQPELLRKNLAFS